VLPPSDTVATTDPLTGAVVAPPADAASGPAADPAAQPTGPATITAVTAFDPDGDNVENDADTALALADGIATTSWATSCYESQYMGGKRGVGLVVSYDQLTQQGLTVDVLNAPYQLQFFAVADEVAPTDLAQWGPAVGTKQFADQPGTVTSDSPPIPVRHVLVLLNELGRDDSCSDAHPYQGRLGEIALVG
jgi:eukaryotic-like serine/threonine-protein kinase